MKYGKNGPWQTPWKERQVTDYYGFGYNTGQDNGCLQMQEISLKCPKINDGSTDGSVE